jgi:hypothetical protein
MKPIFHVYKPVWFFRSFTYSFSFFFPMGLFIVYVLAHVQKHIPFQINNLLAFTIIMVPIWATMILAGNYEPEIMTDNSGLHIRFLWINLLVKWEEVVGVKPLFLFLKTVG